jgi:hypothetical protein
MVRSLDRLPRRRFRAVTLIVEVLYLDSAALIVDGLVFFQPANTAAKTSTTVRKLSAAIAKARVLIKGQPLNMFALWNWEANDIPP